MIADADVSGDGRVDYSEFAHLWKNFLLQKHQKPVAGRLQQVIPRSTGVSVGARLGVCESISGAAVYPRGIAVLKRCCTPSLVFVSFQTVVATLARTFCSFGGGIALPHFAVHGPSLSLPLLRHALIPADGPQRRIDPIVAN